MLPATVAAWISLLLPRWLCRALRPGAFAPGTASWALGRDHAQVDVALCRGVLHENHAPELLPLLSMPRRTFASLVVLLTAACGEPENDNDVEVLLHTHGAPEALRELGLYRVDLAAGGVTHRLTGADFGTTRYGTPHSPRLAIPNSGELRVSVAVVAPAGDTLGSVRVGVRLQADHRYGVAVRPGGTRPVGACVGTLISAPLRTPGASAASDTLWVAYGGLPRGAIC